MAVNIVIDLDGTLAEWNGGDERVCGKWIEGVDGRIGAKDALALLLLSGHRCVVASCRATWVEGGGLPAVRRFLESGGFMSVPVIGREELLPNVVVAGFAPTLPADTKHEDSLESRRFVPCSAKCANGLAGGGVVCATCRGHGVQVEPYQVGVWIGRGKPIAHWYVDDRGVPFDTELTGWSRALEMLEVVGVELTRPVAA